MLLSVAFPFSLAPTGVTNGENTLFTLPQAPLNNSLLLFKNGLFMTPGIGGDYLIMGNQITLASAPAVGG
jgi:hypothetical protein